MLSFGTNRQRFQSIQKIAGEAYGELAVRLHDLASKWLAGCGTVGDVLERLVVKQLTNTMPTEIHVWVAERKPRTGAEAGWLVEHYLQAHCHVCQGTPEGIPQRREARAAQASPASATAMAQKITSSRTALSRRGGEKQGTPPRVQREVWELGRVLQLQEIWTCQ